MGTLLIRSAALVLIVASLAIALHGNTRSRDAGAERVTQPNILLVSIDSLRRDHLGTYGYERATSPVIDSLGDDGAVFQTAVSSSSWTLPAHVTLLTSLPPERHGVTESERRLKSSAVTLAEVLKRNGYTTAGFVAAPYLKALYNYNQGFDVYDESTIRDGFLSHEGATSPRLTELVRGFLDRWSAQGAPPPPFFVFLHLWDVHYHYEPPPPYDTLFDPDYRGKVTGNIFAPEVTKNMAPRDLDHLIALYDGEIRYTDAHLGEIVDHLQRLGVLDDTIIIVTSDHGDEFFEHGLIGHGTTLYDEVILIPLIVRYPRRIAPHQRIPTQVRQLDVGPTLLGLAGISPPPDFGTDAGPADTGRNLAPFLTGERDPGTLPPVVAHSHTAMSNFVWRSARSESAKYLSIARKRGGTKRATPKYFDLESDPGEKLDRSQRAPLPPEGQALRAELDRRSSMWKDDALADPMKLDPTLLKGLQALGYIQTDDGSGR